MEDFITYENLEVYTTEIVEELPEVAQTEVSSPQPEVVVNNVSGISGEEFSGGIDEIVNAINPDAVQNEVYRGSGTTFNMRSNSDMPDYVVTFDLNGTAVYFPTDYSEDVFIVDGELINLGDNYTVGAEISGYNVNNYLNSEITIPTYHSSTWYQYLQNYGQPYRVVDRYYNDRGTITSMTRDNVNLDWSGGNRWSGFTFDKIALFIIISLLAIIFFFRKGSRV